MIAALVLLGLTACGGEDGSEVATAGGDPTATTSSAGEDLTDEERTLKFAECMRDNGIEMSDPEGDGPPMIEQGSDTSLAEVEAAHEKCKEYAPSGGSGDGRQLDPEDAERMRGVAQCMRDNGFPEFPDPDEDGRLVIGEESGIDPTDEKFQEAQAKCDTNAPAGEPNVRPTS